MSPMPVTRLIADLILGSPLQKSIVPVAGYADVVRLARISLFHMLDCWNVSQSQVH